MPPVELEPLPPVDALDFFRQKGLADELQRFDWRDLWRDDHARAFVVAKAMQDDLLRDIRGVVDRMIADGLGLEASGQELEQVMRRYGWWGRQTMIDPVTGQPRSVQLGSQRRIRIILDTNMRTAFAAGQWRRIQETKQDLPYLRYVAVLDERTRADHRRWHDTVLPVDHPWWRTHFPPNGWRCRCQVQQLSERQLRRRGLRVSEAPPLDLQDWTNRRTGEIERIPDGIDPGFDNNPGIAWLGRPGGLPTPIPPTAPRPPRLPDGPGAEEITRVFEHAPPDLHHALRAMPPLGALKRRTGGGSYFRNVPGGDDLEPRTLSLAIHGQGDDAVLRHEVGHALDHAEGPHVRRPLASVTALDAMRADRGDLIRADRREKTFKARFLALVEEAERRPWQDVVDRHLVERRTSLADLRGIVPDIDAEGAFRLIAALETGRAAEIFQVIKDTRGSTGNFSDFFSALTNNRIAGRHRHSNAYYRQGGGQGSNLGFKNSAEAFANYVDAEGSKNRLMIAMLEALAPRTIARFRQIVNDAVRRARENETDA